ncbi:hypothetical protein K4G64_38435, partial [Streptomyces sp. WAC04114]|nr:hypothetical protein [Streptomyces sp. WAC04114]
VGDGGARPGTDNPRTSAPGTPVTDEATDPAAVSRTPSTTPTSVRPVPSKAGPSTDRRTADGSR